jgi:hypothetical protein
MCPWVLRAALLLSVLSQSGAAFAQAEASAAEQAQPTLPTGSTKSPEGLLESLGSYERTAVTFALKKRDLLIETAPEGKTLESIHVVNLDVLGREVGFLRVFNIFHITTRQHVIRREVLLRPGEMWDQEIVEETQRRIKDPLFTSLVVVVPVQAKADGKVSLLVVTRDIWSLRMNSTFEVQQGKLTALRMSVAENNIFGLRKHGAFVFDMGQGSFSLGPQYVDKALAGSRLRLVSRFGALFSRETREFEGTTSSTALSYPLWSLRQKWGAGASISHLDAVVRAFRGTEIELIDNPDTPEVEAVPRVYRLRTLGLENNVVRSFGSEVKQQVTMGHALSVLRPDFLDDFVGTDADRVALEQEAFPRSERASALFVRYRLFTPDFVVYRNLNGYDLAEDVRLGPDLAIGTSAALKVIGSEENFYRANIGAAWTIGLLGDGFIRASGGASTRLDDGHFIDNVFSSTGKVATPHIAGAARLVAQANLSVRLRERGNGRFTVGGNSGLRGYQIFEFSGQKRVITNVELRSVPLRLLFARVGVVAFWDMAHAADTLGELKMKHGLGAGLRYLIPQLQPIVFRFDYAIPLQGPSAGFPGRFSAGVAQTF